MILNQLIDKLQAIKEAEGGGIQVFMTIGKQEAVIVGVQVDRADVLVDENVFLGHCEDYHQCVLLSSK
jgi:hypothetical protein